MARLPLEGIRVIDLGIAWAGPHCTQVLADMGAETIRIENPRRPDTRGPAKPPPGAASRMYPNKEPGERPWNRNAMFNERHRNKYSLTLDLSHVKGKEVFKELTKISDVVVENFAATVMNNLGLGYPVLRELNPKIVMISMSGHGATGPESEYRSYGSTLEMLSGSAMLTGYPDSPPLHSGNYYPDPAAGMLAAGLVVAALQHRRQTGQGLFIDLSQRELGTHLIGDAFMDYSMNKRLPPRIGNRHPSMAPHGCYRCKGEDMWIAISVGSDSEWRALCDIMGKPELAEDERFGDIVSRYNNQGEVDGIIEAWTVEQDHYEAMRVLQDAGIAAGAVLTAPELLADPHLNQRGFFEVVTHPEAGTFPLRGMIFNLSKTPGSIRKPAPCLGEHNEYVLGQLLGMSKEEISRLAEEEVITMVPLD